ncbi:HsdR family type I site-specific deoxyribonuclease [Flavobacterium sp. Sd200]|uniref:type I restriction endonuclease subunit R n=1 Tax=Flavobacterium sp. Sd200 TaxID=2692211 RepID=UPI0013699A0A|nr:HsdR family type I site-specific deoxyribonuclease [Flavobacterium sp. Sd200]MXN90933.1 HsdR family type I site-specific deoxyribonuclease [Flavobacterium sp. Sd200]
MINPIERLTQNRIVQLFHDQLGYNYYGNWEDRIGNANIEEAYLRQFLEKQGYATALINKAIAEAQSVAGSFTGNLYDKNKAFYSLLRYGVKGKEDIGAQNETVFLIDWKNPENNDFAIAEEVTLKGAKERRPDIVLYVNGIALGVLELKRGTVDIAESIRQNISNQQDQFHATFFSTVQVILAGNNTQGLRYGTIETPEKYYLSWKEDEADNSTYKLDKYLLKLCEKSRLLDIIYNCVLFDGGVKKLPRPHQYFALKEAQQNIKKREGGIIWHTQGSGKSIMMVILAKWILENVPNSRIVLLTDRTELDEQIERVFSDAGESISRTTSGKDLVNQLTQTKPRLICSLIHKFGNKGETDHEAFLKELQENPVQTVGDIYVFVDECHRTQSGKLHQTMKAILQNAIFIGFTGTPLLKSDKKTTMEVFGTYIHTYKFNEAVEDEVVKDLVYEGRDIDQKISSPDKIDEWFELKTKGLNDFQKSELKKKWGTMQNVLSSRSRMEKIVMDILFDFNKVPRLSSSMGNAILVASSIYEACKYYELFQRTELRGRCGIVTSYNPATKDITTEDSGAGTDSDKELIYRVYSELLSGISAIGGKTATEAYEVHAKSVFRKEPGRMKLLIVVSKLLTGFDAPPCSYIYIDKKMQDHTLFQAICRVNRLDTDDKTFGYIVDYMGLFENVTDAINVYTSELDTDEFNLQEVQVMVKDRLKMSRERLDEALEELEALCEDVAPPKDDLQYIHYFCGNSEIEEELKANEYKRVALYKAIVSLIRAHANIAGELELAGYNEKEIKRFDERLHFYLNLREIIRIASNEQLDLKAYEADMRHLLDNYIQAEDAVKISPFDDISLLDLMESDLFKVLEELAESVRGNQEAVAEIIENNVRSKIIKDHLLDPVYYDKISFLLNELIAERKRGVLSYQQYLKKIAELAAKANKGKDDNLPKTINTQGKRAIYNYLENDEQLAIACETAAQYAIQEGFRENIQKQNMIKGALHKVLNDKIKVEAVYQIIEQNKLDY